MATQSQQEFLRAAKVAMKVTWDELANRAGIAPRAMKTYRMPPTSRDFRSMPPVARASITALVQLATAAQKHDRSVRAYRALLNRQAKG